MTPGRNTHWRSRKTMKLTFTKCLVSAALLGAALAPLAAQAAPMQHHPGSVNARLGRQDRRIDQGERTGSLTRREVGPSRGA